MLSPELPTSPAINKHLPNLSGPASQDSHVPGGGGGGWADDSHASCLPHFAHLFPLLRLLLTSISPGKCHVSKHFTSWDALTWSSDISFLLPLPCKCAGTENETAVALEAEHLRLKCQGQSTPPAGCREPVPAVLGLPWVIKAMHPS